MKIPALGVFNKLGLSEDKFKKELIRFHESGMTVRDLQHRFGIGYNTVCRYFKRFGIKTIMHGMLYRMNGFKTDEDFKREVARLYHEEKLPLKEVARRMRTTYVSMQGYFLSHKIDTRSTSEYVRLADEDIVLTNVEQEIISGGLLGDGSIFLKKYSAYFSYACKHRSVVDDLAVRLSRLHPTIRKRQYFDERTKKTYTCFLLSTHSYPSFLKLRQKWYPNGKKIIPNDIMLTPETCYWWYLGDGSSGNSSLTLFTNGFQKQDVDRISKLMPNTCQVCLNRKQQPIILITKIQERVKFLSFIGKCRHPVYNQRWVIQKRSGPILDFCCPKEGSVVKDYVCKRYYAYQNGRWTFNGIY
ncbi:MAG: hypothetical protein Q8K86_08310 [Candidatus Nanopelagicaceae bacterium]|nr:hypothetical protein [Candidatus Nanopelagicaceae bacterium]